MKRRQSLLSSFIRGSCTQKSKKRGGSDRRTEWVISLRDVLVAVIVLATVWEMLRRMEWFLKFAQSVIEQNPVFAGRIFIVVMFVTVFLKPRR